VVAVTGSSKEVGSRGNKVDEAEDLTVIEKLMKRYATVLKKSKVRRYRVHDMSLGMSMARLYTPDMRGSGYLTLFVRTEMLDEIEKLRQILDGGAIAVVEVRSLMNRVTGLKVVGKIPLPKNAVLPARIRIRRGLRLEFEGRLMRLNEFTYNAERLKQHFDMTGDPNILVFMHPVDIERGYIEALQWLPVEESGEGGGEKKEKEKDGVDLLDEYYRKLDELAGEREEEE